MLKVFSWDQTKMFFFRLPDPDFDSDSDSDFEYLVPLLKDVLSLIDVSISTEITTLLYVRHKKQKFYFKIKYIIWLDTSWYFLNSFQKRETQKYVVRDRLNEFFEKHFNFNLKKRKNSVPPRPYKHYLKNLNTEKTNKNIEYANCQIAMCQKTTFRSHWIKL